MVPVGRLSARSASSPAAAISAFFLRFLPAADTVVEQSETLYDAAGNRVQSTAWQRFHDAAGIGPLHGPSAAQTRARRTDACWWQDAIGREIAAADYGTKGGAALVRPEVPPASSETVLVTRTVHASTGEPGAVIAPDGTEWSDRIGRSMDGGEAEARRASRAMPCPVSQTRWRRDAIGREVETIENYQENAAPAADVNRTTRFGYHPSGGLETLTLVNDVTGDQTTRWVYGTTLEKSGLATGNLLRAKTYPGGDRSDYAYNKQGEVVRSEDGNGTVHELLHDQMGRKRHDCVTVVGVGVDQTVKRISDTYDTKRPGLAVRVSSYDNATPGSGAVLNEVSYAYDGLGQLTKDRQSQGGAVVPGTTPEVGYAYEIP